MKTIEINGMEFTDFGANNYSCGMHLVSAAMENDLIWKVLHRHYPGIYLNPSAPCDGDTFYGVFGTEEQYAEFYKVQREAQIAKITFERLHVNYSDLDFYKAKQNATKCYFDWWNEVEIEVVQMQGNACGSKALKVRRRDSRNNAVRYTLGFIIPVNYWFEGYLGGINYMTTSFITHQSKLCTCVDEILKEFGLEMHEFNPPKNWDKLNTSFE
mgnify:FL=1